MLPSDDPLHLGLWDKDRVLGTGGFGIVTLWKNNCTQEKVAVKKCRWGLDSLMTETHRDRWSQEVRIMQRLSHPNVVRAVDVPKELKCLANDLPLLCMEFCSGGDLRQILNKSENCCGLREAEVRCLLSDIKEAIQYLHSQRITHRDLKPENIVLQENNNSPMIYKLIDLGYAKELDANSQCSSFVGTMQYLAPEFFISEVYSSSVDYWSLGLVSHEVITGVRPFLPNAQSPVEWMPKVKNKLSNDICVFELPGTKEIKYSQQLFTENFISRCLREELEKWLRMALEWDPKRRGRSLLNNELAIFSSLDKILLKKIVTVFSVTVFACYSYQVDSHTAVSTLQLWIERDTQQPVSEQMLLLPSGKQLTHSDLAVDCWNPNEKLAMLYVFSQSALSLPYVKVADRVPSLVRWLMEHPKENLEYQHQKHVWRHAVFFLRQEFELFQLFLEAYAVKMLYIIEQSCELTQLESAVGAEVQKLAAMHKMGHELLEFDHKCYSRQLAIIPILEKLGSQMSVWAEEMNGLSHRVASYQEAVSSVKIRVQDTLKLVAELHKEKDPGQVDLMSFENWMKEGYKCYDNIRKRRDRTTKHQSVDMARIVYNCFKQIDKTLRNEEFDSHLKLVMACEADLVKMHSVLNTLRQQVSKSQSDLMRQHYIKQKDTWALVKRLASQKEQDSQPQSNLSLNISHLPLHVPSPATQTQPSPSLMNNFVVPPPARNPSPLRQREPQVPNYPSPSASPSPTPSQSTPNFNTSTQQTAMSHNPLTKITPNNAQLRRSISLLMHPACLLESESLIQENEDTRHAMQELMSRLKMSYDALTNSSQDWSFIDSNKTLKNC